MRQNLLHYSKSKTCITNNCINNNCYIITNNYCNIHCIEALEESPTTQEICTSCLNNTIQTFAKNPTKILYEKNLTISYKIFSYVSCKHCNGNDNIIFFRDTKCCGGTFTYCFSCLEDLVYTDNHLKKKITVLKGNNNKSVIIKQNEKQNHKQEITIIKSKNNNKIVVKKRLFI